MSEFQLNLVQSELKIILEALIEKESIMAGVCEKSDDADEIADFGNDLIELRLLLKPLKERAVAQYGDGILSFDRNPL
jgi:hypothetical protein